MDRPVPAAEAKAHFGVLLEKVQRRPITITKKGRPVAVLMSVEEFEGHQEFKLERLRREVQAGLADLETGAVTSDANAFSCMDRALEE